MLGIAFRGLLFGLVVSLGGCNRSATAPLPQTRSGVALGPRNEAVVLFTGDYEPGALDEERWRLRLIGGTAAIVEAPVRAGRFACRFTLEPDQERAELQPRIALQALGSERWYGFSIFVTADWKPIDANEVVAQWKHTNDPGETEGSPPLALRVDDEEWRINCRWDSRRTSDKEDPEGKAEIVRLPYERGRWTDWVFRYRCSFGDDGLIEAWKDGELVTRRQGPNAYNDEQGLYFKWGIYHTEGRRVLVNDELRIGDEHATFADVTPR